MTGAASGIGREIARRLASDGARVVVADLSFDSRGGALEEGGQESTVDLIRTVGGEATFLKTDVRLASDVKRAVSVSVQEFGGLDIMVNNAGIWHGHRTILEETESEFDTTIATNLKGVWLGCKAAIECMVRTGNGGSVVNISSIAGMVGLAAEPAYSASKGGVIGLTRQLALDYASHRVRVNAVAPGFVETSLSRTVIGVNPEHDLTPWPRLGTVSDVASSVAFLCSDDSEWMTGAVLVLDGGYSAR